MKEWHNFHEDLSREEESKGSSNRSFGLLFSGFFTVLAALALRKANPYWAFWVGLALATFLVSVLRPSLFHQLNRTLDFSWPPCIQNS